MNFWTVYFVWRYTLTAQNLESFSFLHCCIAWLRSSFPGKFYRPVFLAQQQLPSLVRSRLILVLEGIGKNWMGLSKWQIERKVTSVVRFCYMGAERREHGIKENHTVCWKQRTLVQWRSLYLWTILLYFLLIFTDLLLFTDILLIWLISFVVYVIRVGINQFVDKFRTVRNKIGFATH